MNAYLALRKTPPSGLFPKLFFNLTRARLLTKYPHGGVVVDGTLYQATARDGVHSVPFDPAGWDLFETSADKLTILDRFSLVNGAKYDWLSLLTFVSAIRIIVRGRWYCYELCHYLLTGQQSARRVTPENLLAGVLHEKGTD
jgi:hypothetical protein